nr:hypothetical protein [uncultured Cohaesibacter sp.]
MSNRLQALAKRILSARLDQYAETLAKTASAQGVNLTVTSGLSGNTGSLHLSGEGLIRAHYGDQTTAPSAIVARLLQDLAQERKRA